MNLAVVIPTRNRADLAATALRSVLEARRPDVAVLVSDNSTSVSERDRLRAHCEQHLTDRVLYVTPPHPLPMAEHWEWARRTATSVFEPTHLTLVTDRMILADGALHELAGLISRYPDRVVVYKLDVVHDFIHPVRLTQTPWTGRLLELDSAAILELSSSGEPGPYLPQMLNCVTPMSVLKAVEARFGAVFGSLSPDVCFGYRCLAACNSILLYDKSLLIHYATDRSNAASVGRGQHSADAADFHKLAGEALNSATPEPRFATVVNGVLHEYCLVREESQDRRFPPLSRHGYLAAIAREVGRMENAGLRGEMKSLLRAHGWRGRARIRNAMERAIRLIRYVARHPDAGRELVHLQLVDRPYGTRAGVALRRLGLNPRARREPRFDTPMKAIAYARRHPRPRSSAVWSLAGLEQIPGAIRQLPAEATAPTGRYAKKSTIPAHM